MMNIAAYSRCIVPDKRLVNQGATGPASFWGAVTVCSASACPLAG